MRDIHVKAHEYNIFIRKRALSRGITKTIIEGKITKNVKLCDELI